MEAFFKLKTQLIVVILGFNLTETKDGTACIGSCSTFIKKKKVLKAHFKTLNREKYYADDLKRLPQFLMEEIYNIIHKFEGFSWILQCDFFLLPYVLPRILVSAFIKPD